MPRAFRIAAVSALTAALSSGCYHATIVTGLPASSEVISKPWAHGFVFGLVPPADVETTSKCKNGVAKVETQQSFRNGLAGVLTAGMYTSWQIDVTCAAGPRAAIRSEAESRSPDRDVAPSTSKP